MTTPQQLRLARWFGAGTVDDFFTGDRGLVPWPRWSRRRSVANRDRVLAEIRATIAGPAVLHDVDPRLLCATQPFVVRHHARFYAEADDYWFAGITSADVLSELNRFPTLEAVDGGRFVIRSGHHRSLVALLAGVPVRARVVGAAPGGPVAVTPLLGVGHVGSGGSGRAAAEVRARRPVVVADRALAGAVLDALGVDPVTAASRLSRCAA